ncbi:dynamin family protein [Okeania sp. SIO2B3]|uniref:dynamin family protein n=1 Tax=Okeania sp. SIO2B3 TaxID=2607784 RepID=UPI0013C1F172|nr:dynamin family protein [Okeania sp. SIO2B3]NET45447.1 GTPase [Okeania sp. SIO2B3]
MTINHQLLQQISAKAAKKQTGVGALPRSIHKTPGLREWVTIQSFALPPVPFKHHQEWRIISLLITQKKINNQQQEWFAPWGAIEWSFSQKSVIQKIDFRDLPQSSPITSLRERSFISVHPANGKNYLELDSYTERENRLFQALDKLLKLPPSEEIDLATLNPDYAAILPTEIYPYYWALIPESKTWLHYDSSAIKQNSENSVRVEQPSNREERQTQPSQDSKKAIDVTNHLISWLHQTSALAKSTQIDNLILELDNIEKRDRSNSFCLVIVGEVNRGKSKFINQIFNRSLVPEGILPTTATLTSITAAPIEKMIVYSAKNREERDLQESSWNDLLATDKAGTDRETFAGVELTVNDAWLKELDVELIDTPGTQDLCNRRAELVFDVLSNSDAAIFVIHSNFPLSLTEKNFLKYELLKRRVPNILVVVSHLDKISVEERIRVINHIKKQLSEISSNIPVLPLHPIDDSTTDEEVINQVKFFIQEMTNKGKRRIYKSQQIAGQITECLTNLINIGEGAIATAKMNPTEKEAAVQKARLEVENNEENWGKIRRNLHQKYQQKVKDLQDKIFDDKSQLLETLIFELDRNSNPKYWWQRELPFRLKRELLSLSRKLEDYIIRAIAADFDWLNKAVSQTFSMKISKNSSFDRQNYSSRNIDPHLSDIELSDLQKDRLFNRLGMGGITICASIFGGPVGTLASMGTTILTEQIIHKKINEQKQIIKINLEPTINKIFEEYYQGASKRLYHLYEQLIAETKQKQMLWLSSRNKAIKQMNFVSSAEQHWEPIIKQASELKEEILHTLSA